MTSCGEILSINAIVGDGGEAASQADVFMVPIGDLFGLLAGCSTSEA
jgi:hypothetical protein